MVRGIVLVLTFFSLAGFASNHSQFELKPSDYKEFPDSLKGRDFFTFPASSLKYYSAKPYNEVQPQDCRAQISKVICLVGKPEEGMSPQDRPCLEGGQSYASYFEQLYDKYPPKLQKVFCSVNKIFIEKKFYGTAWAGMFKNAAGETVGAMMGIRQSVLDQNINLTHWASWKEQLSFGGVIDSYTVSPQLPQILTSTNAPVSDFLYAVVTHEFGHILDFANGLNKGINCTDPADDEGNFYDCELPEGSWGAISWKRTFIPRAENDFSKRTGLCFYDCKNKPMSAADVRQTYAELSQTDFISTYASIQPWDDFAESLSYYMMDKELNTKYVVDTKQGVQYDMMWKLKSPQFAKKYQYIENFLNQTE